MQHVLARTALWSPAALLLLACTVVAELPRPLPGLSTVTTIVWLLGSAATICLLLRRMIDADDRARALSSSLARAHSAQGMAEATLANTQSMLVKLARQQETVRDSERGLIAAALHDELGQTLLKLRVELSLLQAGCIGIQPSLHQRAASMIVSLDLALHTLHNTVCSVRPMAAAQPLASAVAQQLAEFTRLNGIAHRLDIAPGALNATVCADTDALLYRVLQQALAGLAQAASATEIRVRLARSHARLSLRIDDNAACAPCPCALAGLRTRIGALGGVLNLNPEPGGGNTLTLALPTRHQMLAA